MFYSGKNSKNYLFKCLKTNFLGDFLQKTDMLQNQSAKIYMLNPFRARNIPNLKIIDQEGANVYDLLKYKNVIFTITSIKTLQERLGIKKND